MLAIYYPNRMAYSGVEIVYWPNEIFGHLLTTNTAIAVI